MKHYGENTNDLLNVLHDEVELLQEMEAYYHANGLFLLEGQLSAQRKSLKRILEGVENKTRYSLSVKDGKVVILKTKDKSVNDPNSGQNS